jgi:hypothetical protein
MQNVSSKFPGIGKPASPEMVGLGDPGAMTRLRPGEHGGAGRGAQILLGGAGRGPPCAPAHPDTDPLLTWCRSHLLAQTTRAHLLILS